MVRVADGETVDRTFLRPYRVSHQFVGHPLLALPALLELAGELPAGQVELGPERAGAVVGEDYRRAALEVGARAALQSLDGQGRSLFFYNVETVARYAELVRQVLDEMLPALGVEERHVRSREGYLFVSGAASVTPAHVDHECNFLLVAEGRKTVWISDVGDPAAERALEALHTGKYGMCADLPATLSPHELGPGDGIFIPPRAAHYVENHVGRCIALSTVFLHRTTAREVPVYAANSRIRRLGLSPIPPGTRPLADSAKRTAYLAVRMVARTARRLRGS